MTKHIDLEVVERLYTKQLLHPKEIAHLLGVSQKTIERRLRKHGIEIRGDKHAGHRSRAEAQYRDERLLRDLLEKRGMSEAEAAKLLNCNVRNIQYWRAEYGIRSRSRSEAMTLRHSKLLALYKDRSWCVEEYCSRKKSTYQMADELGISPSTVRSWLLRHGIQLRSGGESYHLTHRNAIQISKHLRSLLEGELLGDGSIIRCSERSAFYSHGSKHEKYVRWLSGLFADQGLRQSGAIRKALCNEGTSHESVIYQYHSLCYPELLDWRVRFYPAGKKIVPPDLRLDSIICRQWYIGDGGLTKSRRQRSAIILYTCAFDPDSLEQLREQLGELGFVTTLQPSRNQLYMPATYVSEFLSYIGDCPKPIRDIYGYKWEPT